MVDISGLDKAKVLAALYNAARPQGAGFIAYEPSPMTLDEARGLLKHGTYFDYVKGRVMKVDIGEDSFNPRLYDRDNGELAAQIAIQTLRQTGDPAHQIIADQHKKGLRQGIGVTEEMMHDESHVEGGTLHVGLTDLAEHVRPKVEAAKKLVGA